MVSNVGKTQYFSTNHAIMNINKLLVNINVHSGESI